MMEELNDGGATTGMFVKVMTDEQMEVLRKQIAVYATICEQLVDLHKSLTSQNDFVAGVRLGNLYCDPLIAAAAAASGGGGVHKITGRQRWTPTPIQLQILERIFDQGNGTPTKQKIKDITSELSQHGQISETNVYNWFQNRRARSKRKQQSQSTTPNNTESELLLDTTDAAESSNDNKTNNYYKPSDDIIDHHHQDHFQTTTTTTNPILPTDQDTSSSKQLSASSTFGQMSFYQSMLSSNPRMEHLIGKMEVPPNYNPYMQQQEHDYNMAE